MIMMKNWIIVPLIEPSTDKMQKLGQHFLKNKKVVREIIDALALRSGDIVFEIGPGHGELTEELKTSALSHGQKKEKIKIIAIEKDKDLCGSLEKQFENDGSMEIVCGDALELLPQLVSKLENKKYNLAGNIPYYITGHLLRIISELKNKPERAVFMIQKEVAERIIAQPPAMNRLAASVQFWAEPKIMANVSKYDFRPVPKVDSAVILLAQKENLPPCDADAYYAAMRIVFSQPRKTILNNIFDGVGEGKSGNGGKEDVAKKLGNLGIDPLSRPQNLAVENIMAIAKMFSGNIGKKD